MVQQEVLDYLKEGKARGFSIEVMKAKLMENGFSSAEIDEAIKQIDSGVGEIFSREKQPEIARPARINAGVPWIKVSSWLGIAALIVLIALGVTALITPATVNSLLDNKAIFLAMFVVGIACMALFYSGFIKISKNANQGKLGIGSWLIIVAWFLLLIVSITGNALSSLPLTTIFPIISMSLLVALLVGIGGQLLFSWGMFSITRELRATKIAGIFNVILSIVFVIFTISFAWLSFSMINAISEISTRTAAFGVNRVFSTLGSTSSSVGFFSVMFITAFVAGLITMVFDIMVLRNGSKRYESVM
jgi:hypothetical protein